MRPSVLSTLKGYLRTANQWFLKTPERALDEAYDAALAIKAIENSHFAGGKISASFGSYSSSVQAYFQQELNKNLGIIRVRLTEFKASKSILFISNRPITEVQIREDEVDGSAISVIDRPAIILKKLRVIDEVLARYNTNSSAESSLVNISNTSNVVNANGTAANSARGRNSAASNGRLSSSKEVNLLLQKPNPEDGDGDVESIVDKTGVLPRSILKTVDRIRRELDPKAEEEVVETFRNSRARTIISIRLVLMLIIVPLLTQQLTKSMLTFVGFDPLKSEGQTQVFINQEMEEEALTELHRFEERLEFEVLIGRSPPLTTEERETRLKEKAAELAVEYHQESSNALKNIVADLFSVIAFIGLIVTSKREIAVLKSFIDELIYGLSDSAKAFIIILLTDTFVGFHSPHGWEVLLEGISRHLGLPANRDFIFLFIATFPVILDTIFKYWIFRYLNRISPSAVATYRNMNE
ncbi:MAG TPA: proton extrusion protein PcxA [Chroococcidiopsis sp.]